MNKSIKKKKKKKKKEAGMTKEHIAFAAVPFPNEILTIIIDEVALLDNDRNLATLASCRLVSHLFCSLATPFFFSTMQPRLGVSDGDSYIYRKAAFRNQAIKMAQILTMRDIADSVQTLKLKLPYAKNQSVLKDSRNGTLIYEILSRLPYIRHFVLHQYGGGLDFSAITGDCGSAIRALCRSPNLVSLDLDGIRHFPITFIAACPNLRHLRLSHIEFSVNHSFECFPHQLTLHSSSGVTWIQHHGCNPSPWTPLTLTGRV
jgi:hypothetical protein